MREASRMAPSTVTARVSLFAVRVSFAIAQFSCAFALAFVPRVSEIVSLSGSPIIPFNVIQTRM